MDRYTYILSQLVTNMDRCIYTYIYVFMYTCIHKQVGIYGCILIYKQSVEKGLLAL